MFEEMKKSIEYQPLILVGTYNAQIVTSMNDLCFDLVGIVKEKRDAMTIKSNKGKFYIICLFHI